MTAGMTGAIVYVRTDQAAHEGGTIVGVFSTLEAAQAPHTDWKLGAPGLWCRVGQEHDYLYANIEEWSVQGTHQ